MEFYINDAKSESAIKVSLKYVMFVKYTYMDHAIQKTINIIFMSYTYVNMMNDVLF